MSEVRTPRRNRVTPLGEIVAIPAKGRAMGNRGPLLDPDGSHARDWTYKRWICCHTAEVHGRKVKFDDPISYTPLFFTDEAVALAAGHRPCGSCRTDAYYHWLAIWKHLTGTSKFVRVRASEMDRDLHRRRLAALRKPPISMRLEEVPEGAFVTIPTLSENPGLLWEGRLWPWWEGDYGHPINVGRKERDTKVFPRHGLRFLACGFRFDPALAPAVSGVFERSLQIHLETAPKLDG